MTWTFDYTRSAESQLRKLDKQVARRIPDDMDERVALNDDPRSMGKRLTGPLGDLWRYRIGDCRVICEIRDNYLVILVVKIGHRREVYK
ncbi:MAG TPA: type II toxin-antitoxin system RelE/ParE family toxin [Geothermobacteraceae bacterium]|nr:type II toxin-antitoxin system RelE/ParE family toxin [Geothermobacteraceae bacterium]